jgi:predicted ATP-binding protein involved in virulence
VLENVDKLVPSPFRLKRGVWVDEVGTEYTLAEIIKRFPAAAQALPQKYLPRLFTDAPDALQAFFVETNRLGAEGLNAELSFADIEWTLHGGVVERTPSTRTNVLRVVQYSKDVVQRIKSVLANYAKHSQERDRTFPERLVRFVRDGQTALNEREILSQMAELESKRRRLISLGFLDSESGLRDLAEDDVRRAREALTIYVADVQEKLRVFDDLAQRIGMLMDIVNERFHYKTIRVDREVGFRVLNHAEKPVQLEDLSSGEQHELVVLYELLFRAPKNSLVLVDEPEISLHVAWQSRFLSDLIGILELTDAYAIVATHSPMIIGSRWDLALELKGPAVATEELHA